MNKNAQVTLFIILGLVILLGAIIGYVAYENELIFRPPETAVTTELESLLAPFEILVRECQEEVTQTGAKILLANGGYIDNPGLVSPIFPQGNSYEITPGQNIPYWHYLDGQTVESQQPALRGPHDYSVQSQLEDYVSQRLENCVSFEDFPDFEFSVGEPRTQIQFQGKQTQVLTQWPIEVDTRVGTRSYEAFETSVQAPVEHLYDLVDEQIGLLAQGAVPENNLLRLMSIYATGQTQIPPVYGSIDLGNDFKVWMLEAAKTELAELIDRQAQYLQVYGTQDVAIFNSPSPVVNELQLDGLMISEYQSSIQDTYVRFFADTQNIYYRVDGNTAVAIPEVTKRPPIIGAFIPPLVDYSFEHDISYPLFMTASLGEYELVAGYEANIQQTQAFDVQRGPSTSDEDLCENAGGTQATITVNKPQDSPEAQILYECGQVSCIVGQTDSTVQKQLPACAQGKISAFASGLYSGNVDLSSQAGQTADIELNLYEPVDVQLEILNRVVTKQPSGNIQLSSSTGSSSGAEAILIREQGGFVARGSHQDTIELVPGTYDIVVFDVQEYQDPSFIIAGGTIEEGGESVTIDNIELNASPLAYLEVEDFEIDAISQSATLRIEPTALRTIVRNGRVEPRDIQTYEDFDLLTSIFDMQVEEPVTLLN